MPRSPAARTVRRNASTPRRWPSTRGNPRCAAQRPLPSMMMATCRGAPKPSLSVGAASLSDIPSCLALRAVPRPGVGLIALVVADPPRRALDRHDLFFFVRERLIDLGDHGVGRFLHVSSLPLAVVLA